MTVYAGCALLVIAKEPVPGRVKTRLTPPCTPEQAAALAEAALVDTLTAVAAVPVRRRILVLDGAPGPWLPPGFIVVPQVGGRLDVRLAAAFEAAGGPALLIGMDTPQVTPAQLAAWLPALADDDPAGHGLSGDSPAGREAVFGPAADGGFWALGLRRPDPSLLLGVPMSEPHTGRVQLDRLIAAGLRVGHLPELRDVDTADDARAVAAAAPRTRFAALWRELAPVLEPASVPAQAPGGAPMLSAAAGAPA